jgi:hypothetical protein
MCSDKRARSQHYEFLATNASDPRREFISSLCSALAESGSIVVYSSFESQRLSELASWCLEFADRINAIQARLFDLLPIVRNVDRGVRQNCPAVINTPPSQD